MNGHGGGILLARGGGQLLTCVVCRKPTPPDHIAPTTPREGLCGDCWAKIGNIRNWWRQPCLSNGLPVLDVLHLMLSEHMGKRGDDRNGIRTLARLLWEHKQMQDERGPGSVSYSPRCCYCDEPELRDEKDKLVEMEAVPGLPKTWLCRDYDACDGRVFQRIMLMVAGVLQGQQVPQ